MYFEADAFTVIINSDSNWTHESTTSMNDHETTTLHFYSYYGNIERGFDIALLLFMITVGTVGNFLLWLRFYTEKTLRSP